HQHFELCPNRSVDRPRKLAVAATQAGVGWWRELWRRSARKWANRKLPVWLCCATLAQFRRLQPFPQTCIGPASADTRRCRIPPQWRGLWREKRDAEPIQLRNQLPVAASGLHRAPQPGTCQTRQGLLRKHSWDGGHWMTLRKSWE